MKQGKIIAVVGAPRSGKSFLTDLLAKYYGAIAIHEGETAEIPKRIREDIEKNIRPLERVFWFRNREVKSYLKALELKKEGKIIVLDTFWISYRLYIDTLLKGLEKDIMLDCATFDEEMFPWPDKIIFLKITEKGMREFIKRGQRDFDQSEDFIQNQALPVNNMHEHFFSQKENMKNLIVVERSSLDFSKAKDFEMLVKRINSIK